MADFHRHRVAEVASLREAGKDVYPHKWPVTVSIPGFRARYTDITQAGDVLGDDREELIAGRVDTVRSMGAVFFFDIYADGGIVQAVAIKGKWQDGDTEGCKSLCGRVRRGDIVGVRGLPGRTKTDELSIFASAIRILTPCLVQLPESDGRTGLTDKETRYRQRWTDLIVNRSKVRPVFETRAKIISFIRRFLDERGFLEVETPILNQIAGGAVARPFASHHNELDLEVFMRIAPELYLKKLIVGGFDRVYEIGRNFRNEGIDATHNPEFTSVELYWAYQDYYDLMQMTELMVSELVFQLKGTYIVEFANHEDAEPVQIDFRPPWKRIELVKGIEDAAGFKIPEDLEASSTFDFLVKKCAELDVPCSNPTSARLLDKLAERYVESQCVNPTFVINQPGIMSPLAKGHRSKPFLTERFELFVCHKELCNAYTELNDPAVQKERFDEQMRAQAQGDDEAMPCDESFIDALNHGLPPTAGWGLGIDRLVMFMTNRSNIQEVLFFPQMKPRHDEKAAKPTDAAAAAADAKKK